MGYTHYWRQEGDAIPAEAWAKIMADTKRLIKAAGESQITLWHDYDEPGTAPEVTNENIWFNGADDNGHETFELVPGPADFTFCKTAYKPYDRVVCAILAIAKEHAGDAIVVTSDGEKSDWKPALEWASTVLGRPVAFPVKKSIRI